MPGVWGSNARGGLGRRMPWCSHPPNPWVAWMCHPGPPSPPSTHLPSSQAVLTAKWGTQEGRTHRSAHAHGASHKATCPARAAPTALRVKTGPSPQPTRGDEELRAVGIGAGVRHGQVARPAVGQLEVLVRKLWSGGEGEGGYSQPRRMDGAGVSRHLCQARLSRGWAQRAGTHSSSGSPLPDARVHRAGLGDAQLYSCSA
jgi:hypothetical protein